MNIIIWMNELMNEWISSEKLNLFNFRWRNFENVFVLGSDFENVSFEGAISEMYFFEGTILENNFFEGYILVNT